MARVELVPEILDDFERFLDHMEQHQVAGGPERIVQLVQSLQILTHSPLIGRPVKDGRRELVIGRGAQGFIALYTFLPAIDTVFVLAIRNHRERSFKRAPGSDFA